MIESKAWGWFFAKAGLGSLYKWVPGVGPCHIRRTSTPYTHQEDLKAPSAFRGASGEARSGLRNAGHPVSAGRAAEPVTGHEARDAATSTASLIARAVARPRGGESIASRVGEIHFPRVNPPAALPAPRRGRADPRSWRGRVAARTSAPWRPCCTRLPEPT